MSYAILRTAKLTSFGNIGGSAQHNFRERKTPNADPERTTLNRTSGAQSAKEVLDGVKERLATQAKVRKNAVLAVEYFIGASPEWFSQADTKKREVYFDQAEKWLKERHGVENVIAVTRQYDETSPHVCAYVVPIDPKGKLNCSYFLDGREKLTHMQTDFAEKVGSQVGLERGIEGSKATHKTIRQYYAEMQRPVQEATITPESLKPKKFKEGFLGKLGINTHVENEEGIAQRLTDAVRKVYQPAVQAAKQHHAEKAANEARARELAQLRATATVARDMPLEGVLERLGCERDPKDRKNWRTPVGRVTVDGSKFFAHDVGKGGGGAIDLTMMVEQTDYKGAVNWLAREFGTGAVLAETVARLKPNLEAIAKEKPTLDQTKAHTPEPSNWDTVRGYLVETRRLDARLVDSLHEQGYIYADKFKNAVFLLGKGQGLSLRGTGDKPFHGVRGEKVPFILGAKDKESQKVAFVESPIDALSLRDLGFGGRIVATVGNAAELARAKADIYRQQGLTVVAAFDNDRAGDAMARSLGQCERLKPSGKDWNEDLRAQRLTPTERQALELERQQARARSRGPSFGI